MSLSRLAGTLRWSVGLTLALGLHGAAAAFFLARWHAQAEQVASAPAILVDFAPVPAAPAAKPRELPPAPLAPQQQVQPQQQQQPAPKPAVAKIEAKEPPPKPIAKTIAVPREPRPTIDVLPPRRPHETRHIRKPHHRRAQLASAPASAMRHAARAAATAPGASRHNPHAIPNWKSALVAAIERHKRYPAAARERGLHGVAQVAFSVDRRGGLHHLRVVRSSGSALLDRDALAWLRRSEPLPPPPPQMRGARIPIKVPLRYDIR